MRTSASVRKNPDEDQLARGDRRRSFVPHSHGALVRHLRGEATMVRSLRGALLAAICSVSMLAYAQTDTVRQLDIPAGDMVTALDALARQSGAQFIYQADQLKGLRTSGVHGTLSADAALSRLLQGSGFGIQRDTSGAVVIVKRGNPPPTPQPTVPATAPATGNNPDDAEPPAATELEAVQVTGSRIPRAQMEGPAPVTVITANDIKASGFASVPDVMRAITQNSGETQSQQSSSGADFSPGAEEVDLRGLGPNHTLVLVNGRRIADFPMPFKGRSNFTDVSNIPIGMIDRIEILTGSASAVYGSDAISGVVNFILKQHADGTTIDLRYGDTTRGGGDSTKLNFSTGFCARRLQPGVRCRADRPEAAVGVRPLDPGLHRRRADRALAGAAARVSEWRLRTTTTSIQAKPPATRWPISTAAPRCTRTGRAMAISAAAPSRSATAPSSASGAASTPTPRPT